MDARAITKALGGQWHGHYGSCRCPVHNDRNPSLKVRDDPRKDDGIDVVCFTGCSWRDVKAALRHMQLLSTSYRMQRGHSAALLRTEMLRDVAPVDTAPPSDDTKQRADTAMKLWDQSVPLAGIPAWTYFTEQRGIDLTKLGEMDHALRWHAGAEAVIALMTTPIGNKPCGVHRTFIDPAGTKRERKMLGQQGVVRVSPDEDVTYGLGITEGIENALAVLSAGITPPCWAATSAGGIERFPVLSGIEALTIFRDDDPAGTKAAEVCAARWYEAGREVRIARLKDTVDD